MKYTEMHKIENYFEAFLIIFFLIFFIYLIKSFLFSLLFAATLVFLTYPIYKSILKVLRTKIFSALIVMILVFVIIIIPSYYLIVSLIYQSAFLINIGTQTLEKVSLGFCSFEMCRNIENNINFIVKNFDFVLNNLASYISNNAGSIFNSISNFAINFIIFLLGFFFMLKDGDKFLRYIKRLIPMKNEYKEALFIKFKDVNEAVFIDNILIAIFQGFLLTIGFYIFGIPSPIFWGVVASFLALIPILGAPVVWLPVAVYMFLTGDYLNGIFFALYNAIIVGLTDDLIRANLIKNKIKVHSFLILLSILGALHTFGLIGVFIGPIVISLLVSIFDLYKLDFN